MQCCRAAALASCGKDCLQCCADRSGWARATHLQLVRDQHARLLAQVAAHALVKQVAAHVRVHGGQRVIKQVHVGIRVQRARERDAVLLAARQVDALLANLAGVAGGKRLVGGALLREKSRVK